MEYYRYRETDNGADYIVIQVNWSNNTLTYMDRSKDGFKTWGKLFIDTHGREVFKNSTYDWENTQEYKEEDIKNLQLFSEIKPRLYMELDKYDLLIDPIPDKVPGELPF